MDPPIEDRIAWPNCPHGPASVPLEFVDLYIYESTLHALFALHGAKHFLVWSIGLGPATITLPVIALMGTSNFLGYEVVLRRDDSSLIALSLVEIRAPPPLFKSKIRH